MNTQIIEILLILRREIWEKRRLFALLYVIASTSFLALGWYWPKVYSSSSTILVDNQNILQPLMRGTAVTTEVQDRAKRAREIIFSRRAMEEVLESTGRIKPGDSDLMKEFSDDLESDHRTVHNARP